jgi:hypothetical protein
MPQQWRCCWFCGIEMVFSKKDHPNQRTVDHVTPESSGGDKFVDACKRCNNLKGSSSVQEFREFLEIDKFFGELQNWEPW